ncbi:MAG: metal-dependent transcriptional regulator [Acidobacteriota bacterium]
MPTSTVEDYLKAILLQEQALGAGALVTMGQIAGALEVAPGTVTAMVKGLERDGLVEYEPYSGVRLSETGRLEAANVLRRHRLTELFLVEILGFDWSEVHEEAEQLEHAMSAKLIDRIDALLGHPTTDPHGDPIPDRQGDLRSREVWPLTEAPVGESVRIARVSDQEEAFLRFVERKGLRPSTSIVVTSLDPIADAVTIVPAGGDSITLGSEAAAKLFIERTD